MNAKTTTSLAIVCALAILLIGATPAVSQNGNPQARIEARATNTPLQSLAGAANQARARGPRVGAPREVANFIGNGKPAFGGAKSTPGTATLQDTQGNGTTSVSTGFYGADNNDNGSILGFLIAPPDTDGAVGPNHFVQMINLLTTVYDKNGNEVQASFPSNAYWSGIGGNCEPYNQGDPVVLYDDAGDRWLVSQFAFPDNQSTFSQCVAVSQTGDPTGAYNRYEFSFTDIGFNDYPKHGFVTGSITMIANLFEKVGQNFSWDGTFLGVMDKGAMYAGETANLVGFNIGSSEFGFVAGDLDGSGSAEALFATAMSNVNSFDIWRIDIDWSTEAASVNQIASIPITAYDSDLCSASREACIHQPDGGPQLEAISDRLMHRLQLRDFGTYRTMLASHTVDVGGGRAGIRWYEMRESGGTWSLYQEGTFGPDDGEHRFMPSAAMNLAGDIGIGYLLASTNTYVSTAAAGQSAASSGSGLLDSAEMICAAGTGVQEGTARSGDYSATSVDPLNDQFWHTNEVFTTTGNFQWATFVCEFSVGEGGSNTPPTASFTFNCDGLDCSFSDTSTDSDGSITGWSWSFGDGNTSTAQSPTHTYASDGSFSVTLTVTDDGGANDSLSQTVTASSAGGPPTASFTFSCNDLTCSFMDTSTDSGGTVVAWSWNFGDRGKSFAQNPTHTYRRQGTYDVYLTVTDNDGDKNTTSESVTVPASGNNPPNASFTYSCNELGCSFTDASTDTDGTITAWSWDFGDGGTSSAQNPGHTYGSNGTYTVSLTVTDNEGATDGASQSVTVSAGNAAPAASFTYNCNELDCSFTDTSTDSDGTITAWSWSFGDGATSSVQNPGHTYGAGGTFTVTLTVTDNDGDADNASQSVTVSAGNTQPTASFAYNCNELDCSFTDTSTDSDGTITAWSWSFGDGGNSSAQNPGHTYPAAGTYTVSLTVTDNDGANDNASLSVAVTEPSGDITLTATAWRRGIRLYGRLNWSGATGGVVDIFRNGAKVTTTSNDGYHLDYIGTAPGTYNYQVCEANSSVCSNPATVDF